MRRTVLIVLAALLMSGGSALAENYPSHPITLVVPFSAGGPTDSMARIMADRMKTVLGQSLLIEMSPARAARSESDASRAQHPTATPSASAISAPTSPMARSTSSATTS